MDQLEERFAKAGDLFTATAATARRELTQSNRQALIMLEKYQPWVARVHDGLLKVKRSVDVNEFLANSGFDYYKGGLVNHPIEYVGDVGFAYLEAKPNSGFCGANVVTFVAI